MATSSACDMIFTRVEGCPMENGKEHGTGNGNYYNGVNYRENPMENNMENDLETTMVYNYLQLCATQESV